MAPTTRAQARRRSAAEALRASQRDAKRSPCFFKRVSVVDHEYLRTLEAEMEKVPIGYHGVVEDDEGKKTVCVPLSRWTDYQAYYECPFGHVNEDGTPWIHQHGGHSGRPTKLGLEGTRCSHCGFAGKLYGRLVPGYTSMYGSSPAQWSDSHDTALFATKRTVIEYFEGAP